MSLILRNLHSLKNHIMFISPVVTGLCLNKQGKFQKFCQPSNSLLFHSMWDIVNFTFLQSFNSVLQLCPVVQLCLTLCNPMDCSLPGSSVHGISLARIRAGLPFPPAWGLPTQGLNLHLMHWQAGSLPLSHLGSRATL